MRLSEIAITYLWHLGMLVAFYGWGSGLCHLLRYDLPVWITTTVGLCVYLFLAAAIAVLGLLEPPLFLGLLGAGLLFAYLIGKKSISELIRARPAMLLSVGVYLLVLTLVGLATWERHDDELAYAPLAKSLLAEGGFAQPLAIRAAMGLGGQTILQATALLPGNWAALPVGDAFLTVSVLALALLEAAGRRRSDTRDGLVLCVIVLALLVPTYSLNSAPTVLGALPLLLILSLGSGRAGPGVFDWRAALLMALAVWGAGSLRVFWGAVAALLVLGIVAGRFDRPASRVRWIGTIGGLSLLFAIPSLFTSWSQYGSPFPQAFPAHHIAAYTHLMHDDWAGVLVSVCNVLMFPATLGMLLGAGVLAYVVPATRPGIGGLVLGFLIIVVASSGLDQLNIERYGRAPLVAGVGFAALWLVSERAVEQESPLSAHAFQLLPLFFIGGIFWSGVQVSEMSSRLDQLSMHQLITPEWVYRNISPSQEIAEAVESIPVGSTVLDLTSFPRSSDHGKHEILIADVLTSVRAIQVESGAAFIASLKDLGIGYLLFTDPAHDPGIRNISSLSDDSLAYVGSYYRRPGGYVERERKLARVLEELWQAHETRKFGIIGVLPIQ